MALLGVHYGIGKHLVDVPPDDRSKAVMWRWLGTLFYIALSALTKVIVGLLLLRICSVAHLRQRFALWAMMIVVGIFTIYYIIIAIIACQPLEYNWTRYDPHPGPGKCNAEQFATVTTYVAAFINVAVDWGLAILPATLLWKAQMSRRTKMTVWFILALGSM